MTEGMHCPDPDLGVETLRIAIAQVLDTLRAVRLYTLRHPVSSQALARSHQHLIGILSHGKPLQIDIAGSDVLVRSSSLNLSDPFHASLISGLADMGVQRIEFVPGLTRDELESFFVALASPAEELSRLGGLAAVLVQQDCAHIRVAGCGASNEQGPAGSGSDGPRPAGSTLKSVSSRADKKIRICGTAVPAGDIIRDPERFGGMLIERSGGGVDAVQEAFVEAARQMREGPWEEGPALTALGQAVVTADQRLGGALLRRLRQESDLVLLAAMRTEGGALFSAGSAFELLSSQAGDAAEQVAAGFLSTLSSFPVPAAGQVPVRKPRPRVELDDLTKQLVLSPEEVASLRDVCSECSSAIDRRFLVRALTGVLTEVLRPGATESGGTREDLEWLVDRLEGLAQECFRSREFSGAAEIIASLARVSDPALAPRAARAIKAAADRDAVGDMVRTIEAAQENDPARKAVMTILSHLGGEATPVLLEMLAEEPDRSLRMVLTRILKDLGKNQIALLGERLSDERWYFVRNIVTVLGESRKEEAVAHLETAAQHRNFQVRQEVVKALVAIGGEEAAGLLVRFLNDKDVDIRFMAVRGLGTIGVAGPEQEQALIDCVRGRWFRKTDLDLRREAVSSLGMIGGRAAEECLSSLLGSRPGKGRNDRDALANAARDAIERISGRPARG